MVSGEQGLASSIGLRILKSGGNAVDAAVAMGFALAVALPNAGNIGGGGFMIVHDAKSGKNIALDFREVAPSKATRDMYVGADGKVIDGKSLYTHIAVGGPGNVAGNSLFDTSVAFADELCYKSCGSCHITYNSSYYPVASIVGTLFH